LLDLLKKLLGLGEGVALGVGLGAEEEQAFLKRVELCARLKPVDLLAFGLRV